ncbi:lipase family protein [Helicobacter pullorum]|uniref:lipase family protein n=1 Tax=Helicobacter pullorum TaxID=35818 RepID=UPI000980D143|nr:Mbeg1-like protein [Helicobacter pullorum]
MKETINNLKDYAELAQASYFYFDLLKDSNGISRKIYELDSQGNKIKDESYPRGYKEIEVTLGHIVSQRYKGQEVLVNLQQGDDIFTKMRNDANETFNFDKLNGEFREIQARNFAKRYEVIFHQPNTLTGFSATLFSDKTKNRFIVGFRGTEGLFNRDIIQDIALSLNTNPQSFALLDFLKEVKKIVRAYNRPIIFVGHSLGGYLAQVALIYCDKKYKDELLFSPKEVYTFNAPSIYGWNLPNVVLNPNTIKILLDFLEKNLIDISEKLTHIYDSGGINIIASAQYGSRNRLPIYTGKDSHSIIPLTQTLYFYSYLLELESNDTTIQRSIAHRKAKRTSANNATTNTTQNTHIDSTTSHKDTKHNANADSTTDNNTNTQTHNTLADYLHELNVFMDNIRIAMNILVYEIDRENQEKYEQFQKQKAWYEKTPKHNDIDFLALLISQINEIAYKLEALKEDSNTYFTPSIDKEHIVEALLEFIESNYFIQIFDNELLRKMRNQCKANAKSSIQEKLSLATCQPFSVVSGNETSYINDSNYHEIYGYKGLGDLLSQEWHEEFTNGKYKIAKGLYFNGNTYSSFTKYMIHNAKEKEVIC